MSLREDEMALRAGFSRERSLEARDLLYLITRHLITCLVVMEIG